MKDDNYFTDDEQEKSGSSLLNEIEDVDNDSIDDLDEYYEEELDFDLDDDFFEDDSELLKEKKKCYYVKKADLLNEIMKYQNSKKNSPDGRGVISDELRNYDHEDLHKVLNASSLLSLHI